MDVLAFGLMFHSFCYPEEIGENKLISRFWAATMEKVIIEFPQVDEIHKLDTRFIRDMLPEKAFNKNNIKDVNLEHKEIGE